MYYFISIMCAHNVSVSSSRYIWFALILWIHINYVWKELTVQDTFKRSCIRSRLLCGTNWACEETTWGPKPYPPHPTPLFVSGPLSGVQEDRGGKGRSRCWSSPASWAPTAFSHGSDPPYMSFLFSGHEPIYFTENKEKTLRVSYDRDTHTIEYMN